MFAFRIAVAAALLSLSGAPLGAQAPAAPTHTVELSSYAFAPTPLRLASGQAVTLTFVNRAGKSHDFTAPEFFAHSKILAGSAPGGRVELKGGASASITLIPAAGTYAVKCSHFLHAGFGMRSEVIVN